MKINDITTTLEDAPEFSINHRGKSAQYPESFKARHRELYPNLSPLFSKLEPKELFMRARLLAEDQPRWWVSYDEPTRLHFEAEATTKLLRFTDDVIIEVRPHGEGSALHMRSRSRWGRDDFGANAKRITGFIEQLKKLI